MKPLGLRVPVSVIISSFFHLSFSPFLSLPNTLTISLSFLSFPFWTKARALRDLLYAQVKKEKMGSFQRPVVLGFLLLGDELPFGNQ